MSTSNLPNIYFGQAKKNLRTLSDINNNVDNCIDWQVTLCFYVAVHLMKSHLAHNFIDSTNHEDLKHHISGCHTMRVAGVQIPDAVSYSYSDLENLSRKARYLFPAGGNTMGQNRSPVFTENELVRALVYLDEILVWYSTKYGVSISATSVVTRAFPCTNTFTHFNTTHVPYGVAVTDIDPVTVLVQDKV